MFGIKKVKEYCDSFVDFYYDAYWASSTLEDTDELETIDAFALAHIGCKAQQIDIILGNMPAFVVQIVIEHNGIKTL